VRILALDTATENCSAALLIDGRLIAREALLEREHAARVLPMVDELLKEARIGLADLSAIAFGRGPGAFTGVRLAASVTQGLAFGSGVPVVPVSNLRALAQRVMDLDPAAARVLVCSDARMSEVYWGCFERAPSGIALAVSDERVAKPAAVALPARWRDGSAAQATGSGFAAYPELRSGLGAQLDRVHEGLLPRANEIAVVAAAEVADGRTFPAEEALPVYLRDDVTHGGRHSH
jgi:tRNA threonylcarbamoyladenosine biosynthesis protein TsaB